jgi:hypothetical protein
MKKALLAIAVVLAFTLSMMAQTASGGAAKKTSASKTDGTAAKHQLTGCLGAKNSEGAYVLTNGNYKKGVEVGGNDDLSKHVGHQVKLTGMWVSSGAAIGEKEDAAAEKAEAKEKGKKAEAAEKHFKVDAIDMIADSCKATAGAAGGKKSKKPAASPSGL